MKKFTTLALLICLLIGAGMLPAQTVKVTFNLNTATVPDTTQPPPKGKTVVQIRGGFAPLTWDQTTPANMTNIGGDYWTATVEFPADSSGVYKFFVSAGGTPELTGWEAGDNILLTTGSSDTTLPLHYFRVKNAASPFEPPYTPSDSLDIWFRCNVAALLQLQKFNPATEIIGVRGLYPGEPTGTLAWGDLSWGKTAVLSPESPSENGGQFGYPAANFWSGRVRVPNDSAATRVDSTIGFGYKFVIADKANPDNIKADGGWEDGDDRRFPVPQGLADTTVYWRYYNDSPPREAIGEDTVNVKFVADMSLAEIEGGFNLGVDTLFVQYGHDATAILGTDTLVREGITKRYSVTAQVNNVQTGGQLQYEYRKPGQREYFYDFTATTGGTQTERRKLDIPESPQDPIVAEDVVDSKTDMRRKPRFRNSRPLPENVSITYECDLRPAYFSVLLDSVILYDIQGDLNITPAVVDSIFKWGVWMNGPASKAPNQWLGWGTALRNSVANKMWDDGQNGGDITAGDSLYSLTIFYSPDSGDVYGQEFKYGLNAGDNEGGDTLGFGNNHLENIILTGEDTITFHTQFGSIKAGWYSGWDFDNRQVTNIDDDFVGDFPDSPELYNNYPNPFNPSTIIRFSLPTAQNVKLVVYNALGQKVYTLFDGKQRKGLHIAQWNGIDQRGRRVSSGVYFYRLEAEDFEMTKKMVLLK